MIKKEKSRLEKPCYEEKVDGTDVQNSSVEDQKNYVYVECPAETKKVSSDVIESQQIQEIQNTSTLPTQPAVIYPSLQNIDIPSSAIQFQTYNIPMQMSLPNQILTLGQVTSIPTLASSSTSQQSFITNSVSLPAESIYIQQPNISILHSVPTQQNSENVSTTDKTAFIKIPIKIEKDVSEKSCSICGKICTSETKLARHMKIHVGDEPYRCNICHKGFTHCGNYKVHMRMHTDERPFKCQICSKAFRQQQDMDKHMRTHTGERPHPCKICTKAFTTSSNLIAHMRIHNGEKPYVCSICQKSFCQSNELTKHARTHTGEKSHICNICNKGFNGSSTLTVHMRSHTGEKPYQCNICKKSKIFLK